MTFLPFRMIRRAFRPLDTTEADAAIAAAARAHQDVRVRARALRMDVSCGDPIEAVRRLAGDMFNRTFPAATETPPDMKGMLGKL